MSDDTDEIEAAVTSIAQVVAAFGLKPRRGRIPCPWHVGHDPNCSLIMKGSKFSAHCHVCHEGGNIFALFAALNSLDLRADFVRIKNDVAAAFGVSLERRRGRSVAPAPKPVFSQAVLDAMAWDEYGERWLNGRPCELPTMTPERTNAALELLLEADREHASLVAYTDDRMERIAGKVATLIELRESEWNR